MLALYDEASTSVHPNHHVLCDLAKWLAPVYCRCSDGAAAPLENFPRKDVERKRDMCSRQIRILVRWVPQLGYSTENVNMFWYFVPSGLLFSSLDRFKRVRLSNRSLLMGQLF